MIFVKRFRDKDSAGLRWSKDGQYIRTSVIERAITIGSESLDVEIDEYLSGVLHGFLKVEANFTSFDSPESEAGKSMLAMPVAGHECAPTTMPTDPRRLRRMPKGNRFAPANSVSNRQSLCDLPATLTHERLSMEAEAADRRSWPPSLLRLLHR
jgi:hypothetical protein